MLFHKRLRKSSDRTVLVISMIVEIFWYVGLFLIAWYVANQCFDVCAVCMNCTPLTGFNVSFNITNSSNITFIGGLV